MIKLTKIAITLLIIGFLVSLSGILMATNCEQKDFDKCLLKKEYLLSDFNWHFNTIKYISSYGYFPYRVAGHTDGGPKGDFIPEDDTKQPMFHPPLYYFLAAIPYKITQSLFVLHIFSIFIMLLSNIIFFLFLKEVSKKIKEKNRFILYSLALFIFLPIQLYTSIMIHPGILFTFFFVFSLYFFIKAMNFPEKKNFVLLGIVMGLLMLSSLNGFVVPFSLFFYLIILLIKKNYIKAKLFFISLLISIPIGSYQFIKNFLIFKNPFGPGMVESQYFIHHKFTRLLDILTAYWGGIYGGNDFIHPLLVILISILILIIIYSLISLKSWKNLNLGFTILVGLMMVFFIFNLSCNFKYLIKSFECVGGLSHARYLVPISPIIAIFPSIIFSKIKNNFLKKIVFLFTLIICALFSIDFIWAFL